MAKSVLFHASLVLTLLCHSLLGQEISVHRLQNSLDSGEPQGHFNAAPIDVAAYPSGYFDAPQTISEARFEDPSHAATANIWVLGGFAMLLAVGLAITGFCIKQQKSSRTPPRVSRIRLHA